MWSPSGCRLVCSLRQTAQDAGSTPRMPLSVHQPLIPSGPGAMPLPLESGISALTWGAAGYSLLLTETASSGQVSTNRQTSEWFAQHCLTPDVLSAVTFLLLLYGSCMRPTCCLVMQV